VDKSEAELEQLEAEVAADWDALYSAATPEPVGGPVAPPPGKPVVRHIDGLPWVQADAVGELGDDGAAWGDVEGVELDTAPVRTSAPKPRVVVTDPALYPAALASLRRFCKERAEAKEWTAPRSVDPSVVQRDNVKRRGNYARKPDVITSEILRERAKNAHLLYPPL